MDSDLDFYQLNMVPSDAPDDDEDCDDYSLEEGWPDEESEAA
jgi:hypothetical protein